MSERADLPDVPEAAVLAATKVALNWFDSSDYYTAENRPPGFEVGEPLTDADDAALLARRILTAALPKLVEQGWTPPDAEAK